MRSAKPRGLSQTHFTFGAVIGIADLVDVEPLDPELEENPWATGPYCWHFANARMFPSPISCKGKLKLYVPDDTLAAQIQTQLALATSVKHDDNVTAWLEAIRPPEDMLTDGRLGSYQFLGDWPNLGRLSAAAMQADSEYPSPHFYHGWALKEQGRFAEALRDFDAFVRMAPDEPAGYFFRGQVLERLGETDKAASDLARAREIDPSFGNEAAGSMNESADPE